MDQDSVHMVAASKVPMLKPGESSLEVLIKPLMLQKAYQSLENHGETISLTKEDVKSEVLKNLRDGFKVADGYANNEGKEILKTQKEVFCEWAPRNQENRNKKSTRRSVLVETTTSNALISCDGLGDYDWSDQAEEGPTNFALIAYTSTSFNSEVSIDSNCSSSCLENVKILKEQNEQLLKDLRTSRNFMPPKHDLSFSGLEEFVNEPIVSEPTVKKPIVETSEAKASADKPYRFFKKRSWLLQLLRIECLIVRKKVYLRLRKRRKQLNIVLLK
ncbi:hypothetical protein Tco_1238582 [Tanacetum coccineum]